jgi:hypothetical protein
MIDHTIFVTIFNGPEGDKQAAKAALHYLTTVGVSHARDIASTLFEVIEQLNPGRLGQCLGNHEETWQRILAAFPFNFEFHGLPFIQALRKFLWSFKLPGESMQIDRIMQSFAHAYMEQHNRDPLVSTGSKEYREDATGTKRKQSMRPIAASWGWYTSEAFSEGESPCCINCGVSPHANIFVASEQGSLLYPCRGCRCVTFCRKCSKFASRYGHAVCGRIGYGRACMAALELNGMLENSDNIEFSFDGKQGTAIEPVSEDHVGMALSWKKKGGIPFRSEDAAFIFAFSVIMLTTNLHNPNVKEKMTKRQFLATNRGINDGANLPGDYVTMVYDDIKDQELKFRGQA